MTSEAMQEHCVMQRCVANCAEATTTSGDGLDSAPRRRRHGASIGPLIGGAPACRDAMTEHPPLSCQKCPSLCCRMAGYVQVSRADIRRLAKFLGLTVREFEAKHIVEVTRKRAKLIKSGYETCQFLSPDRRCTVYKARPKDCR